MENLDPHHEFEGFELLDMEQMWEVLHRMNPKHISRDKQDGIDVILWESPKNGGVERQRVWPFTTKSIMAIFDAETD